MDRVGPTIDCILKTGAVRIDTIAPKIISEASARMATRRAKAAHERGTGGFKFHLRLWEMESMLPVLAVAGLGLVLNWSGKRYYGWQISQLCLLPLG